MQKKRPICQPQNLTASIIIIMTMFIIIMTIFIIIWRSRPESEIGILQVVIDDDYVEVTLLLAIPDMIIIIISIITWWIVGRVKFPQVNFLRLASRLRLSVQKGPDPTSVQK